MKMCRQRLEDTAMTPIEEITVLNTSTPKILHHPKINQHKTRAQHRKSLSGACETAPDPTLASDWSEWEDLCQSILDES